MTKTDDHVIQHGFRMFQRVCDHLYNMITFTNLISDLEIVKSPNNYFLIYAICDPGPQNQS